MARAPSSWLATCICADLPASKVVPEHGDAVEEVLHSVSITHTNVCCVRNARPAGSFVIVMDYVAGGTLADLLSKEGIPLRQAIAIFRGICSGVRDIDANKVRHLDLKPETFSCGTARCP